MSEALDVGGDRDGGVGEGEGFEVGGEGVLRGLHEGAVEGGADLEHDGALGSGVPCRGRRRGERLRRLRR